MIEYNYERLEERPVNVLSTVNNGGAELLEFRNMVQNSDAQFFVYGWSTKYSPPEILPIIREKFPYLIEKKCWFNSAIYCFSKLSAVAEKEQSELIFFSRDTFLTSGAFPLPDSSVSVKDWSAPCKLVKKDTSTVLKRKAIRGNWKNVWKPAYLVFDSACIYGPLLKMKVGDILKNPDNEILFTVNMKLLDTAPAAVLVIEFQRDGKQLYWNGMESAHQIENGEMKFQNVYFGLRLPKDLRSTDTVSFYCYSKNGKPFLVDFLDVRTLKGHTGIYGPRADLQ
jgi:hypothetical protein